MNIGEIKAFLGKDLSQNSPDGVLKKQLKESALAQASELQHSFKVSAFSSQLTVGASAFNGALNRTLVVNEQRFTAEFREQKAEENKRLFDFEEVATNVLRFVGGAIRGAASNGADDAQITQMFAQAREGVMRGIKMAEDDLGGLMNDDISTGIAKSQELIELGIKRLEFDLLGIPFEEPVSQSNNSDPVISQQIDYRREDSGSLQIRTKDGDEVTIKFEDIAQFKMNQQALIQDQQLASIANVENTPGSDVEERSQRGEDQQESPTGVGDTDNQAEPTLTVLEKQQSYSLYERDGLSVSVQGNIDEDESKAIGELVSDARELARTFFSGDVEQAFSEALLLGIDEGELASFALQLNRKEQVQVVQAYEQIQQFNDESSQNAERERSLKPIADYLEKMLELMEQASNTLYDGNEYEKLMTGVINEAPELNVPDLLNAINTFYQFNNGLISSMPSELST